MSHNSAQVQQASEKEMKREEELASQTSKNKPMTKDEMMKMFGHTQKSKDSNQRANYPPTGRPHPAGWH